LKPGFWKAARIICWAGSEIFTLAGGIAGLLLNKIYTSFLHKEVNVLKDCIFCKIASGEVPGDMVYRDERVIAINDIDPKAPVHILIMPKDHIPSLNDIDQEKSDLVGHIFMVAAKLASQKGIAKKGYRVVNNCGVEGGQSVEHIHFHLLGGRNMAWPPG
jgi:histidine triad (HIT) family protein